MGDDARGAEIVESGPEAGRRRPRRVGYALLALFAVAAAGGVARAVLTGPAPPRGPFVAIDQAAGLQRSATPDPAEYGYITAVQVVAPDVAFVSAVPLDASGRTVGQSLAAVDRDGARAQEILYGIVPPPTGEVTATAGEEVHLALRLRPACAPPAPVVSVRFTLRVRGVRVEQVVPLPDHHRARHVESTAQICRAR